MLARSFLWAVVLCAGLVATLRAADPEPIELTFDPAPEPVPALRYQFIPSVLEQHPGNAALHYMKGMLLAPDRNTPAYANQLAKFQNKTDAEFNLDEAEAFVAMHASALSELQLAITREECDWQLPVREQHPFLLLLPEVQEARWLAWILAIKARCEIQRGKMDDAFQTLRTGLTMARQVSASPTLISGLVGISIETVMLQEVERWIAKPGSPNLYWAIRALPQPMHDFRLAINVEKYGLELAHPELQHVETLQLSEEGWRNLLDETFEKLAAFLPSQSDTVRTAAVLKVYFEAKPFLTARGWTEEQVTAMPVAQAVLLHDVLSYREGRDAIYKLFYLPIWQINPADLAAAQQWEKYAGALPIGYLLQPVDSVLIAQVRSQRRLAAIATIEAIRMHAADNGGKLPATLADIRVVSVPLDPANNQPFDYEVDGDTATLLPSTTEPVSRISQSHGFRYELTVRPASK